jgi:hypothetical protein
VIRLWGVWECGYESDELLGLYTEREPAEQHATALGYMRGELTAPRNIEVREHEALSTFAGLEGSGQAVRGARG